MWEMVWLRLGTTLTLLVVFEFQVGKDFLAGGDYLIKNKTACFSFFLKIH